MNRLLAERGILSSLASVGYIRILERKRLCFDNAATMAHAIPTGSGNTLPDRMTRQEQAFSQLMDRLGNLLAGYVLMNNLGKIKAISAVLRKHMRSVDATLDSLRKTCQLPRKLFLVLGKRCR
ncbi:hypothetical protein ACH5RR_039456 [Cinchona calisaya]|uniref:Uncharacterized protein n=1 Tax=Cinchona calisaya TaxID=153742 RepID=A0ABD2XZN2_9GENT